MTLLNNLLTLLTPIDWCALALFIGGWAFYNWYADKATESDEGLRGVTHRYRIQWGQQMVVRENRIVDAALTGNLMNSTSFYANATIYIIAGLIAVAGTLEQLMRFTEELPFVHAQSRQLLEIKLFLMIAIFIFAYFKFTWALRQFNILSILIGAAPKPEAPAEALDAFAERYGTINTLAGDEFNRGIRAYYFGFAALAWFIGSVLFGATTLLILVVLWRRDFHSRTLAGLM
jgi:uncharacterized membrane protein